MRIEKNTYDKSYPYTICDGWGGRACASLEDLEDLMFELERITKEEKAKGKIRVAVKVVG
jgi:hypothetical protein